MAVLVAANLSPRSEALWTQVKILTDGARDSQAIEFIRAVVTLIPAAQSNVNTELRLFFSQTYLVKISVIPGFSGFFGGIFSVYFTSLQLKLRIVRTF